MASASINDIKGRIKSVEGTMQITKAMELVATSKLRRAKERAEASLPYMNILSDAISVIAGCAAANGAALGTKGGKTLYIVIAGDRGLAGGYNSNIFKLAKLLDKDKSGIYVPIGKKAADYFTRREHDIMTRGLAVAADVGVGDAMNLATDIFDSFMKGEISAVKLVYTKFVSMLTQTPVYEDVLPLEAEAKDSDLIIEEEIDELLKKIIPEYLGGMIYSAVCESLASECASRRTAMNSANKNAEEMIGTLVLKFNRARQAVITQEITEIVSGAEAL